MERIDARREPAEAVADRVAAVVRDGGVVVFPTDTVYGIGCDPRDAAAVGRVFALKGRPRTKPLALHFSSVVEALEYAPGNPLARRLAEAALPGPLTLVVARPRIVSPEVTAGLDGVGLRVPDHPLCLAILDRSGPLAATSANLSGEAAWLGDDEGASLPDADLVVDAGRVPVGAESTVVDVTHSPPRIIREGALSAAMIDRLFRGETARP